MRCTQQVLVVDDDEDIRESLIDFLEDHGFEVLGAPHGGAALQLLTREEVRPCLIILDLMMPIMDGQSFRAAQLQAPGLSKIPVVVISAYREFGDTARNMKVVDHLPKPLNLNALLTVVRQHCAATT